LRRNHDKQKLAFCVPGRGLGKSLQRLFNQSLASVQIKMPSDLPANSRFFGGSIPLFFDDIQFPVPKQHRFSLIKYG
jgi:hypothetical protein